MRFKLYILVQIIYTITPIRAAFKDFVIENEKDLQRFGISNDDMNYADDDLEYQFLDGAMYDNEDDIYGALDSSCGVYDEDMISHKNQDNAIMFNFDGKIDGRLLNDIIRQLVNDPRCQHLKDFLTEDNLLLDYNIGENNENYLTQDYVDYFDDQFY